MEWADSSTRQNTTITMFVAFNYGGRAEIVDAARQFKGETRMTSGPACMRPRCMTRT